MVRQQLERQQPRLGLQMGCEAIGVDRSKFSLIQNPRVPKFSAATLNGVTTFPSMLRISSLPYLHRFWVRHRHSRLYSAAAAHVLLPRPGVDVAAGGVGGDRRCLAASGVGPVDAPAIHIPRCIQLIERSCSLSSLKRSS